MQADGVQVNPREWWDEHWIQDRIMSKLAPDAKVPRGSKPEGESTAPHRKGKRHKK